MTAPIPLQLRAHAAWGARRGRRSRGRRPGRRVAVVALLLAMLGGPAPLWAGDRASPWAEARSPLALASVHAAVIDLASGDLLYRKRAERAVPIASLTKLMTAMVVLDSGQDLGARLEISGWGREPPNNGWSRMRPGSRARREDLVRIALMSSENLATHVLARHHPGGFDAFVRAMNDKAAALGMTASRFVEPSGLDPRNRASAADLARMIRAAHGYARIREYSTTRAHQVRFDRPGYRLRYGNTNPLVADPGWPVILSKTGYLGEAGRCLALISEVSGRPVLMAFLNAFGSRSPLGDAGRVRRWLTTGRGGAVAGPALEYERRAGAALEAEE